MSPYPNDDIYEAEEAETPITAKPLVPVTEDRWYVMRLDGARFGPFLWKEHPLDELL